GGHVTGVQTCALPIFFFLVVHLSQFKFGTEYLVQAAGGLQIRDLYRLEMEQFASPLNVLLYLVGMILVGFHLWHGSSSAFNSIRSEERRVGKERLCMW